MMDEENQEDKPEMNPHTVTQELLSKKTQSDDVSDPLYGWVVVFASFTAHVLFVGINLSFGVIFIFLLEYYNRPRGETALIGSIPFALVFLISPLSGFLTNKYGCRRVVICGALIGSSGFIISSLVTSMDFLYITYGVLVGVGQGLMCLPSKVIVNQYMHKRRGLANGISSSGGGVGVIAITPLYTTLYRHYSLRGLFLVMGAVVLNAAVCGALCRPLIKQQERQDHVKMDVPSRKAGRMFGNFCRSYKRLLSENLKFTVFVIASFLLSLGSIVPHTHLPRKARDHGLPDHEIAWFVPLIGVGGVFGRLVFGCIVDTWGHVTTVWSFSSIMCGVSLLLCPIMTSFPSLIGFSITFGTFTGVWIGMVTVVLVEIVGLKNLSDALGILQFLQGCGILVGSPFAGWLFDLTGTYDASFYASGSLFVTSGLMVLLAYWSRGKETAQTIEITN